MIKRMNPILFAALWLVVVANSFATETFENVALYVVSESESGPTLAFDGFRSAPFAESPVVSDEPNSGIVDVKTLADAIGTAPNLDAAKVGELAGAELNGDARGRQNHVDSRDGAASSSGRGDRLGE